MELVKNIFFNTDKLVQNSNIKITYTGELFSNNSEKVFLHYGYGINWDNINEIEMNKTELGFQAELTLPEADILNFCFRNSQNNWDNNQNMNYTFEIEKPEVSLIVKEDSNMPLASSKHLRKSYILKKKIKLAVYKMIKYFPKILSGNYKKKLNTNH